MKVGFKVGDHWYSSLTRIMLCSAWSHGAVAIETNGEWRLYESTARKGSRPAAGVRDYLLTNDISSQYLWVDLGIDSDAQALAAYELIRGHGYDFFSLLAYLPAIQSVFGFRLRDSRREYCYEVVALMLGMPITGRVTPEAILLFILKKALTHG